MAAHRLCHDVVSLERGLKIVQGSFRPNGSSAPLAVTGKGVSGVARTGTGAFTITLDSPWNRLLAIKLDLRLAATGDQFLHVGATNFTLQAPTIALTVRDVSGAAAADVAANAGNVINFTLILQNSTLR